MLDQINHLSTQLEAFPFARLQIVNLKSSLAELTEKGQFRCLASFLFNLGLGLGSQSLGVLRYDTRKKHLAVLHEVPIIESELKFEDYRDEVIHILGGEAPGTTSAKRFDHPPIFRALRILPVKKGYRRQPFLFLCRVQPPLESQLRNCESMWLFVLELEHLLPPQFPTNDEQLGRELEQAANLWFHWEHLQVERRKEKLLLASNDQTEALAALAETMVRPLVPHAFSQAMDALALAPPADCDDQALVQHSNEWTTTLERLAALASECKNEIHHNTCLGCRTQNGKKSGNLCPQANSDSEVILALANLYSWRTRFWRVWRVGRDEPAGFAELLKRHKTGLREAARLLDRQPRDQNRPVYTVGALTDDALSLQCGHERTLLRFFVARAIPMALEKLENRWKEYPPRPDELTFLSSLADLAALLLSHGEWKPMAIRNLIRVISRFGHYVLDIPDWLDLARHLRQTLRGESALYTLKQRYRDHFFHTVEVCLLGFALLLSRPEERKNVELREFILRSLRKSRVKEQPPFQDPEPGSVAAFADNILAQWWVAALIHDTAYGIDVLKGTLDLLGYFNNFSALGEFTQKVKADVRILGKQCMEEPSLKELSQDKVIENGDHGAITASHLIATLRKHGNEWVQAFTPAARAVALHNTKNPKVDAGRDPIAALLILCDTVQDWGRSSLGYDRSPTVILSRLVSPAPPPEEEQFGPVTEFNISTQMAHDEAEADILKWSPKSHWWTEPRKLSICLTYSPKVRFGPFAFYAWADTTHNLQRVDFRAWDLDVRVTHRIPVPRSLGNSMHLQDDARPRMQAFADFVRTREAGFLKPWLEVATQGNPNGALCYACEDVTENGPYLYWEIVTWNLTELGRRYNLGQPLMSGTLQDFGNALKAWPGISFGDEENDPDQRPPA